MKKYTIMPREETGHLGSWCIPGRDIVRFSRFYKNKRAASNVPSAFHSSRRTMLEEQPDWQLFANNVWTHASKYN